MRGSGGERKRDSWKEHEHKRKGDHQKYRGSETDKIDKRIKEVTYGPDEANLVGEGLVCGPILIP